MATFVKTANPTTPPARPWAARARYSHQASPQEEMTRGQVIGRIMGFNHDLTINNSETIGFNMV